MAQFRKKVIKVTLDASKTVAITCSTSTVDLTNDIFTSDGHGFKTGDVVDAVTTGGLPTGLAVTTAYYVRNIAHDQFALYGTRAQALATSVVTGRINITAVGVDVTFRLNAFGVVQWADVLPAGAIITNITTNEITNVTSGGGATVTFGNGTDSISALITIATFAGIYSASLDGTNVASLGTTLTTVSGKVQASIATAALLTGKVDVYIEYIN